MQHHALLETYLRQLRLPTFAHNYAAFAAAMPHAQVSLANAISWPSLKPKSLIAIPTG